MKIVEPKYEILTDISEGGIKELQQIERVARVCYKSEDKITPDGESAKKLVGFLVKQGHEAMLEHSQLSVLFTCDRGVANYREWRNIFKLRTPVAAHPQMRELMCLLLLEVQKKIPVVFDDIYTFWPADDQTRKGSMVKE